MLTSAETTAIEPQPAAQTAFLGDSLFRTHFDNLPGPAYIWKRSGDDFALLAYNRAAASLSFSNVAALVGTTVRALQPNVKPDLLTDLELCASRGTVVRREIDHRYIATDTVRRLALSLVPLSTDVVVLHADDVTERRQMEQALRDSESQHRMIADITGRTRAEQALRESEVRGRALLDAHPDLIARLTGAGRYLELHCTDKRLERHLPCSPQEFIGKNVGELFDPAFARQHERLRRRALATGEIQRWEYVRRVQGSDLYLEARFVKSGDDEVVVTVRDITQRVELEREVIASSERERTRLGHDLHDGLAQLLIGVKLMLETLTDKLAANGSRYSEDAGRAANLVTRAISQTSELAQGLSPIRKHGRLADALKHLASQSEQLLGIRCSVASSELPLGLDESAATHLYRIVQEAITNAVKHGKARAAEVACKRQAQQLVLTITDDGSGIQEGATDRGGMGTHIMRYRARSIGGDLTIAPRPEGGTVVTCIVPWPAAPPSAVKPRASSPA